MKLINYRNNSFTNFNTIIYLYIWLYFLRLHYRIVEVNKKIVEIVLMTMNRTWKRIFARPNRRKDVRHVTNNIT